MSEFDSIQAAGFKTSNACPRSKGESYFRQLSHPDKKIREAAAKNLWQYRCETLGMLKKLIRALGDNSWIVRMYAKSILTRLGKAAVPTLLQAFSHSNKTVRKEAIAALENMGRLAITAVPTLKNLAVNDPDYIIRIYAEAAIKTILSARSTRSNGPIKIAPRRAQGRIIRLKPRRTVFKTTSALTA